MLIFVVAQRNSLTHFDVGNDLGNGIGETQDAAGGTGSGAQVTDIMAPLRSRVVLVGTVKPVTICSKVVSVMRRIRPLPMSGDPAALESSRTYIRPSSSTLTATATGEAGPVVDDEAVVGDLIRLGASRNDGESTEIADVKAIVALGYARGHHVTDYGGHIGELFNPWAVPIGDGDAKQSAVSRL